MRILIALLMFAASAVYGQSVNGVPNQTVTGTSNPSTCTTSSATSICVTLAPYYASPAGATTAVTTGGGWPSGTTAFGITSCSTFLPNEGVFISGAGVSGANYIGTIVSCSGTTLTVTPASSSAIGSAATVQHDETAAINAAITALGSQNGGGDIWFPTLPSGAPSLYLVNGPLQDPSGSNSILPMPVIANYGTNLVRIGLKGLQHISANGIANQSGAIIQTSATSGNLISGFDSATGGGFPPFTNVWLDISDLTFDAPDNPSIVMINATTILNLTVDRVVGQTTGITFPSHSTSAFILEPEAANNTRVQIGQAACGNYYTCFQLGEHSQSSQLLMANAVNGVVFDPGTNSGAGGTYDGNAISVDYIWCQNCTNTIAAGAHLATLDVQVADIEAIHGGGNGINDPSNLLNGKIGLNSPTNPYCNVSINGGNNLRIAYLQCANTYFFNGFHQWQEFSNTATPTAMVFKDNTSGVFPFIIRGDSTGQKKGTEIPSDAAYGFGSTSGGGAGLDTGLSRDSAGVVDVGNGTTGDKSGSINLANLTDSALTSTHCVQAGTAGLLTTISIPCLSSLTTTGTSGAATLSGGTLNIPNYGAGTAGNYVNLSANYSATGCTVTSAACVVTGSPVSTITISSIPGTYLNLRVTFNGQTTNGSFEDGVLVINSDTTSGHYAWWFAVPGASNTISSGAGSTTTNYHFTGLTPTATTGQPTSAEITIIGYAGTTFNKNISTHSVAFNSSNVEQLQLDGTWKSTAAITSLTFTTASGANFPVGTSIVVYGTN